MNILGRILIMINVNKIRKDFPMLQNKTQQGHPLVYLDNAATTFKPQCVIDACNSYYLNENANSHRGDYDLAFKVDTKVDEVRTKVANFINAEKQEIVFTSGTSMSLNMIAFGYGFKFLKEGDEILLSEAEHASNVLGFNVDIKEISKIAHEYGAVVVCDGAQSVPHMKTDVKDLDCDFLSFSAHKMCGPTGIGILYGKFDLLKIMDPLMSGGGDNARFDMCGNVAFLAPPAKFEAGTLNLEGIYGLGACIDYINNIGLDNISSYEKELRKYAINKLKSLDNIIIYNETADAGIITINVKGVFPQDEASYLNSKGICVRSGEHCAKLLKDLLKTVGTVRISFYFYNTFEEIDTLYEALKNGGDFLDAYFN